MIKASMVSRENEPKFLKIAPTIQLSPGVAGPMDIDGVAITGDVRIKKDMIAERMNSVLVILVMATSSLPCDLCQVWKLIV